MWNSPYYSCAKTIGEFHLHSLIYYDPPKRFWNNFNLGKFHSFHGTHIQSHVSWIVLATSLLLLFTTTPFCYVLPTKHTSHHLSSSLIDHPSCLLILFVSNIVIWPSLGIPPWGHLADTRAWHTTTFLPTQYANFIQILLILEFWHQAGLSFHY